MSSFCLIDDKMVPMYRILWISSLPHFCGEDDCDCEGKYEVRLEQGESIWANTAARDKAVAAIDRWQGGLELPGEEWDT